MAERNLQPTLADLLRRARELSAEGIRVCVPARVTRYDPVTRAVDVQPIPKRTGPTGTQIEDPGLVEVPVSWPGTAAFRVRFPLRDGDLVWLHVADRNIDDVANAMQTGQAAGMSPTDPVDARSHDLSDCFASPAATFTAAELAATALEGDRLVVEAGSARLALSENGQVAIGSAGAAPVELLSLLDQLIGALQTSVVDVLGVPSLGAAAQATLATVRTSLTSIRGSLP